jgi:tripartite-type tricarboxylate transporter receptor subunit TctC
MPKLSLALALATLPMRISAAQDWPTRPVTMVVPFGAGTSADVLGRILASGLSQTLGHQVIVENVGGAGGMNAANRVAKASPDGYQFVLGYASTHAINQTLYKSPPYNAATDFTPVMLISEIPLLLVARTNLPVNNLSDFIAYTKANQQ